MIVTSRMLRPTKTWAPCNPVRQKKTVVNALSRGANPIRAYSVICVARNVKPIRKVRTSPAFSPARSPRLTEVSAQCTVKLDVTRIAVFTPATKTGRWKPTGGQCGGLLTTRTKK